MKTGLPSAIVYGWDKLGTFMLKNSLYAEQGLVENIIVHSIGQPKDILKEVSQHAVDVVVLIGQIDLDANKYGEVLAQKIYHMGYDQPNETDLANFILSASTDFACGIQERVYDNLKRPLFSIFTPAYKTGDRIRRAYSSIRAQSYQNWEWVIVDDSPADHNETWQILQEIARDDFRVRPIRMTPNSGGNIGEVKHRAAMLCNGMWLVELDHDDQLISTMLEDVMLGAAQYPDAGFIYTDCAEPYEDGTHRAYTETVGEPSEWYGNPQNTYVWAFGGHAWTHADGAQYLWHRQCDINPKTIRFNIGMPNHARIWRKDVYHQIGGHNRNINVADDFELILKTFLNTRMLHIKKMLYLQWNNRQSTVDFNGKDINRRARVIKDFYDLAINRRIKELGFIDWSWDESTAKSYAFADRTGMQWGPGEQVMNYIIE